MVRYPALVNRLYDFGVVMDRRDLVTNRPKITVYLAPGYKSALDRYLAQRGDRVPSRSNVAAEIIESFIDNEISVGRLNPISDEDIQKELS